MEAQFPSALRWLALALLLPCACSGRDPGEEAAGDELPIAARAVPPASVVATVNGSPITAGELEAQARAARQSPREALRALIREELLVQEADRRGHRRAPEVRAAQTRALANLLLERDFRYTLADVPRAELAKAYELNKARFEHPELVTVSHIVVLLPKRAPPALVTEAGRLARRVHGIAIAGKLSEAEFKQIAPMVGKESKQVGLRAETLTTPRKGFTVEEFAAAAFALQKPGEVSPVTQSSFGFHVIYLSARIPAARRGLDDPEVDREIRAKIYEESRKQAFLRYLAEVERRHQTQLHPERISARAAAEETP